MQQMLKKICSSNTDKVIDAYEHAVTGHYPRARYLVGPDAKYFWWMMLWMPEWLGDWILAAADPPLGE